MQWHHKIVPYELDRLVEFAALLDTLESCRSRKLRRTLLVLRLRKIPRLKKYFRAALDPNIKYHFTLLDVKKARYEGTYSNCVLATLNIYCRKGQTGRMLAAGRWKSFIDKLEKPMRQAANAILRKDLSEYRVTKRLVNSAFRQLKLKEIP